MKKLLMVFISVIVLLLMATPSGDAASTFKDVPSSYYAYKEITSLVSKGVIKGFADNTFRPTNAVTREEFATFVARSLNLPAAQSSFKDVKPGSPLYDGISRAANVGIIRGFADGTFKGGHSVTREDMAVMLDRAMQLKGSYTKTKALNFSDASRVGGYAKVSVQRMYNYGIMGAYTGTKFDGKIVGTRAETARYIYRMLSVLENGSTTGTPGQPPSSTDIETIKKKNPLTLTHAEIVKAYGPLVIHRRFDLFGKVRGIQEWDIWSIYTDYLQDAKEYKYPKVHRPDEWLAEYKELELYQALGEVDTSYPNYEVIAMNGMPFLHSELFTGNNVKIYNEIVRRHGDILPTPPKENGHFKIDLHYGKNDFATYFKESVGISKQVILPYTKNNKALMVDVISAFAKVPQVKVTSNSIAYDDKKLIFTNGSMQAKLNGENIMLTVAPELENGVQMLPIREIARLIGLETRILVYGAVKRIEILNYRESYSEVYK